MKKLLGIFAGLISLALPALAQPQAQTLLDQFAGIRPVAYQGQDRDDYRWGSRNNRGRAQLSADDQQRFDSYYSRWLQYRRTNNRDEIVSMERRMQDIYSHYGIPSNTPYDQIASNGGRGWGRGGRDRDHDNDGDEGWRRGGQGQGGYGQGGYGRTGNWQGRLSPDDQRRFDSYYSRWQQYRATNNQGEVASMEGRMREIYAQYGIPRNTPFGAVASQGRY
jgi:hypothetical protein